MHGIPQETRYLMILTSQQPEIAHKRGIKIVWTIQKDSNAPHPNTTKITVKNEHKSISVTGISICGDKYPGHGTQWFCCFSSHEYPTIIIVHQDVFGDDTCY